MSAEHGSLPANDDVDLIEPEQLIAVLEALIKEMTKSKTPEDKPSKAEAGGDVGAIKLQQQEHGQADAMERRR